MNQNKKIGLFVGIAAVCFVGAFALTYIDNQKTTTNVLKSIVVQTKGEKLDVYISNLSGRGDEDHKKAYNNLAYGKYKEALEQWEKINKDSGEKKDSEKKIGDAIMLASAYLAYGNAYYKEEEYAKKSIKLLESLKLPEGNGYYNYYMGYSYEIMREYDKAISYYKKAIKGTEGNEYPLADLYNQLGHAHDLKGEGDTAFSYYNKAYILNKKNVKSLMNMARSLVRKNNIPKAISFFERAVRESQNSYEQSEIMYSIASLTLLNKTEENIKKALTYADQSVSFNPENTNAHMVRGKALFLAGRTYKKEAIYSLEKAIELYKNNHSAYEILAQLYLASGEESKALKYFDTALENVEKDIALMKNQINPNKAQILFIQSLIYAGKKENKKAFSKIINMLETRDRKAYSMFDKEIKKKDFGGYSSLKNDKSFLQLVKKEKNK